MAVVGEARVGKSHFMLKLLHDHRDLFDVATTVRVLRGKSRERDVMAAALAQHLAALDRYTLEHGLTALRPIDELVGKLAEAINGSAATIKFAEGNSWDRTRETTAALKGPTFRGISSELSFGHSVTQGSTASREVEVPAMSTLDLAELVMYAHQLVRQVVPSFNAVIVLDDFDLIHRGVDGSYDPEILLEALTSMTQEPGLHVMTTVRPDTAAAHRGAFHEIAEVGQLTDADLRSIYDVRIARYNDGNDVLAGALASVVRAAAGRVGVFLENLESFHFDTGRPVGLDYREWLKGEWRKLQARHPQLSGFVVAAVRSSEGRVGANELQQLRGTTMMRCMLDDYTTIDAARVRPEYESIIREELGA